MRSRRQRSLGRGAIDAVSLTWMRRPARDGTTADWSHVSLGCIRRRRRLELVRPFGALPHCRVVRRSRQTGRSSPPTMSPMRISGRDSAVGLVPLDDAVADASRQSSNDVGQRQLSATISVTEHVVEDRLGEGVEVGEDSGGAWRGGRRPGRGSRRSGAARRAVGAESSSSPALSRLSSAASRACARELSQVEPCSDCAGTAQDSRDRASRAGRIGTMSVTARLRRRRADRPCRGRDAASSNSDVVRGERSGCRRMTVLGDRVVDRRCAARARRARWRQVPGRRARQVVGSTPASLELWRRRRAATGRHESIAFSSASPLAISSSSASMSAMISSGGAVLDLVVDDLLVAVEREVVALGDDVGLGDEERLLGAGPVALGRRARCPAGEHVGQVVGLDRVALVVEGEAVGADVVEPDVVGAAGVGLGEEQDRGRDAGVRAEDARRAASRRRRASGPRPGSCAGPCAPWTSRTARRRGR